MTNSDDKDRGEIIAKLERAHQAVAALCSGQLKWTMSVPVRDTDPDIIIGQALVEAKEALARSSCAAQEPIPEHYSLDEVAARTLRDWLNDGDGGLNDVTIHVGRGHGGPGLYVSLTEYPEEGAALLVEAPQNESRSAAAKPSAGTGS